MVDLETTNLCGPPLWLALCSCLEKRGERAQATCPAQTCPVFWGQAQSSWRLETLPKDSATQGELKGSQYNGLCPLLGQTVGLAREGGRIL